MTRATRRVEYTGATAQRLYLAFELGIEEWKLGFTTHLGGKPRLRVMPARDLGRLAREIADAKQWYGFEGVGPCAELLRGRARRLLVAATLDGDRNRQPSGGFLEH